MRPIIEWCVACIDMDAGRRVLADRVLSGVPLCIGCASVYADDTVALKDFARLFKGWGDEDQKLKEEVLEEITEEEPPTLPDQVKEDVQEQVPIKAESSAVIAPDSCANRRSICKCGCGETTRAGWDYKKGHNSSPTEKYGVRVEREGMTVEAELSLDEIKELAGVTPSPMKLIEPKRITHLIAKNDQPITHLELSPKLARAIWDGLTQAQKAEVFGVDSIFNDMDEESQMICVSRILVIAPDEVKTDGEKGEP